MTADTCATPGCGHAEGFHNYCMGDGEQCGCTAYLPPRPVPEETTELEPVMEVQADRKARWDEGVEAERDFQKFGTPRVNSYGDGTPYSPVDADLLAQVGQARPEEAPASVPAPHAEAEAATVADDGIKLTDDEREALETWDREGVYACPHTHHCPTPDKCREKYGLHAAVESIVAGRVQALTAELDELRGALNDQCDWGNAVADRDAARAELAAANTRAEALSDELTRQLAVVDEHEAANAALSARLDRVTAVVDDWSVIFGPGSTIGKGSVMWKELLAALGDGADGEGESE